MDTGSHWEKEVDLGERSLGLSGSDGVVQDRCILVRFEVSQNHKLHFHVHGHREHCDDHDHRSEGVAP